MLLRYSVSAGLLGMLALCLAVPAFAQANLSGVVLNEILADPNSDAGPNFDTDGDGTAETDDEFIELFNGGLGLVDLGGWQLYDASTTPLRHTFPAGTVLNPAEFIVIVGGWDPGTPPDGIVVANGDGASMPGLGVNNTGDEFFLYDPDANAYIGLYFNAAQAPFTGPGGAANAGEDDFGSDTDGEALERVPAGSATILSGTPTPGTGITLPATEDGPGVADVAFSAPRPNPTAASATFSLTVARPQPVEVAIYDGTGRRVAVLLDRAMRASETVVLSFDASSLPAGVYVVRARGEDFAASRRVAVVR